MKRASKTMKFLLITLLTSIALLLSIQLISFDKYKTEISNFIYKQTGLHINIDGDIRLSLLPELGVNVNKISLKNTGKFSGTFLHADKVMLNLSLSKLLSKQIVINGIELYSPTIHLTKLKTGGTNFNALISAATSRHETNTETTNQLGTDSTSIQQEASTAKSATAKKPAINIKQLKIKHASLRWQDYSTDNDIELYNLNLTANDLNLNSSSPMGAVNATATFKNLKQKISFPIDLNLTPTIDLDKKQIEINPLTLKIDKGVINGNAQLTLASAQDPQLTVASTLTGKNLAIQQVLSLSNQPAKLNGATEFDLKLKTKGKDAKQFKRNLDSNLNLTIHNGKLHGIDVMELLKFAENSLNSLHATLKQNSTSNLTNLVATSVSDWQSTQSDSSTTDFTKLKLSAAFAAGVSQKNNFLLEHEDIFNVKGQGKIDLANDELDLSVKASYSGINKDHATAITNYLLTTPLTIQVKGAIANPKITPNMKEYLNTALKSLQRELLKGLATDIIKSFLPNIRSNSPDQGDN